MNFRFNARSAFLTYAQCGPLLKEELFNFMNDTYGVEDFMIGEETHQDGGRHLHAYFRFKSKVHSRDPRCFDINQNHPNIKTVRQGKKSLDKILEYIGKEDPSPSTNMSITLDWGEIFQEAKDKDDFLRLVKRNYPRDYALNCQRLEYVANREWKIDINTINMGWEPDYTHDWPDTLDELRHDWKTSLVIVGTAGKIGIFTKTLTNLQDAEKQHGQK